MTEDELRRRERAARFGALADPVRLAIVDELWSTDRSPRELGDRLAIESNLLAHHLDVLERLDLIVRSRSSGDGRRRYVHLRPTAFDGLLQGSLRPLSRPVFVCTRNSARSQLAAALWTSATGEAADSAGTEPADQVHPGAVAAARRAGLDLSGARPRTLADRERSGLVITVCDRAHEALDADDHWLHWSVSDPVATGDDAAFDSALDELRQRIGSVVGTAGARS